MENRAVVYLGTTLIKHVCLATFLQVSDDDSFDPYQRIDADCSDLRIDVKITVFIGSTSVDIMSNGMGLGDRSKRWF